MDHPVSINIFDQIQSICRDFRHELKKGETQSIEDFVERIDKSAQLNLFQNLLHIDIEFRRRKGETPQSADYAQRFPQFARLIRQAFFEDTMISMDPMQDTPAVDSAHFADPSDHSFDSLAHQQAAYAPMEMPAARRIGDYELIRELGRGGMGVVYEAKHLQRQNHVALKTLPTGVDGQEVNAERLHKFRNEFRSLSEINHPNLVGMQTLEVDGGQWFFTMDLIIGQDFLSYVRPKGQLDTDRLRQTLKQLATGIIFLHESGIVHRDLKPSNVLVDETGRVSLLDFGLVAELQQATDKSALLSTAHFVGTPRYAAPEQMFGERTQATDWYALGTMLYEALTGAPPFDGKPMEVLKQKQSQDPPILADQELRPVDLATLADGLLKRDPVFRKSTQEVIELLEIEPDGQSKGSHDSTGSVDEGDLDSDVDEDVLLIGREQQLDQLDRIKLDFLSQQEPVIVWVTGLSGEGKSVLVDKFIRQTRTGDELFVLSGRCYDRESVPFKAIDCWIDSLVRFLRSQTDEQLSRILPDDIHLLSRLFPLLRRVDAIATKAQRKLTLDDRQIRFRGFAAFRELLQNISKTKPILLFIDDLQWGDADSAQAIRDWLVPPNMPAVMFIGSYRADEKNESTFLNAWSDFDFAGIEQQEVQVGPLDASQCATMLVNLLGIDKGQAQNYANEIVSKTHGNSYLIRQMVEGYDESTQRFHSIAMKDILRRKFDRLPNGAEDLLTAIAVAGQVTDAAEVFEVAGQSGLNVGLLTHMSNEQLVRMNLSEGHRVDTYHDKIRESVLEQLDPDNKRALHQRFGELIEKEDRIDPDCLLETTDGQIDIPARVTELAHHFFFANDSRAFAYQLLAGEHSASSYAFEVAAEHLEKAESLLPSDASESLRFRLWERMAWVYSRQDRRDKAFEYYGKAKEATTAPLQRATASLGIGYEYTKIGKVAVSIQWYRQTFQELGLPMPNSGFHLLLATLKNTFEVFCLPASLLRSGNKEKQDRAKLAVSTCSLVAQGATDDSLLDLLYSVSSAPKFAMRSGDKRLIAMSYCLLAGQLAWTGFNRAKSRCLAIAEKFTPADEDDLEIKGQRMGWEGLAESTIGDPELGIKLWVKARELMLRTGELYWAVCTATFTCHTRYAIAPSSVELDSAKVHLEIAERYRDRRTICWADFCLARAYARFGNFPSAMKFAKRSTEFYVAEPMVLTESVGRSINCFTFMQSSLHDKARYEAEIGWRIAENNRLFIVVLVRNLPLLIECIAGPRWNENEPINDERRLKKLIRQSFRFKGHLLLTTHIYRAAGRAKCRMGNLDSGIRDFQKAIDAARYRKDSFQLAKGLLDLAAVKEENREENRAEAIELLKKMESVIPRAESWLLGDQYDEQVVAPEFDLEAWEKENGPVSNLENIQ